MVIRCSRNVTLESVLQDAEVSTFVSDCGLPLEYTQDSYTKGYTLSFEVARISPEMEALLTGKTLLADTGVNVGTIEEAASGCTATASRPTFVAELFYQVITCDADSSVAYKRVVVPGIRFAPVERDKEGQINIQRYTGTSYPVLADGLIANNDGPFNDFPAAIVTDIGALDDGFLTTFLDFADPITDPTAGLTLAANTCYTATVPVAAP